MKLLVLALILGLSSFNALALICPTTPINFSFYRLVNLNDTLLVKSKFGSTYIRAQSIISEQPIKICVQNNGEGKISVTVNNSKDEKLIATFNAKVSIRKGTPTITSFSCKTFVSCQGKPCPCGKSIKSPNLYIFTIGPS